ncbi:MAG: hypothetical protein ABW167_19485 [Baekduia sp.]
MLVDYEKVARDLKAYIAGKGSHGQRDLLAEIGRLEAAHKLEEGLPEMALRLYGVVFSDALLRPALGPPVTGDLDGPDDRPERRSGGTRYEEDTDGRQHRIAHV